MLPTCETLRSDPMTHRFGGQYALPGLTNFRGCVQVDYDPVGVRSLNFPPFGCADVNTANLFVDDRYFAAYGAAVTFTWYPDRVVREAEVDGLRVRTETWMPLGTMAVAVAVAVENRSGAARQTDLRVGLRASVTKAVRPWNRPEPPSSHDHDTAPDEGRGAVLFRDRTSAAVQVQGLAPRPPHQAPYRLGYTVDLAPGETFRFTYLHTLGETEAEARATYDALLRALPDGLGPHRAAWDAELTAAFTPGNDTYSGHLPTLVTEDAAIWKLYYTGALGVLYFRRDSPFSAYGRAYDTLMPRYWQGVTFLWDYFLSSFVHAQLDPAVLRKYLDRWMHLDIHEHFGTNYVTGEGVGNWYAVNDFAMVSMAHEYVRWTGDRAWLTQPVPGGDGRIVDYLRRYATNWQSFRTPHGLADYGGLNNLLECVHTYLHEVPSLNAANVQALRQVAHLGALVGEPDDGTLEAQAQGLLRALQPLYVPGKGYWRTRFPDGTTYEVRHCLDLLTLFTTIPDDLTPTQRAEMAAFFRRELQTPTWMHALSPGDDDVLRDIRPDHQWTGAYPAWPPETARGLYRVGEGDATFAWLHGLARSANQGPFGQAHFVETCFPPEHGGARKVPPDPPYINDWTCSSNGSWVRLVMESLFGLEPTPDAGLQATPRFGPFDPTAELLHIPYQGATYHASKDGVRRA